MTSKQPGWKIYKQQMEPLNRGDALWEPASIYSCKRVEIGDVGYIRRGRFHLLFSAGCPLGSRKLGADVPLTFEPLDVGHIIYSQPQLPGYICTNSVREIGEGLGASVAPAKFSEAGTTFSFELNGKQGAALVTKYPTYREDAELESPFEEYTKRHYDSWVTFARNAQHGNDIKPVLVTGVDMTRDFAMMAYSDNNARLLSGFTSASSSSAGASASPWGKWHTQGLVHTNCGPQPCGPPSPNRPNWSSVDAERIDTTPNECDQCVFVRYYTMRKRALMFPDAINPHELDLGDNHRGILPEVTVQSNLDSDTGRPDRSEDSGSDCASSVTLSESNFEALRKVPSEEGDTFDDIAKYVFENSDAEAVVMHHRDIYQIREGMTAIDISETLSQRQPAVVVGADGVGRIAHGNSQQLAVTLPGTAGPSPVVAPLHTLSEQPSGIEIEQPSLSCPGGIEIPLTGGLENYPHSQRLQSTNSFQFQPANYVTAVPSPGFQFLAFPPPGPPIPPPFLGQSPQWNVCEPIRSPWNDTLASAANSSIVAPESATTRNIPVSSGEGWRTVEKRDMDYESTSSSDDDGPGGVHKSSTHLKQLPPALSPAPFVRLPGACIHCKKLKMKCVFPENENICKRCKDGGRRCVVEGRRRGGVPNKRELLIAQIKQKDAIIESLKKQLQNPCAATPSAIAQHQIYAPVPNENTKSVVEWLEKLTASFNPDVQTTDGTMRSQSSTFAPRLKDIASDTNSSGCGMPMVPGENARDDGGGLDHADERHFKGAATDPNLRSPSIQQDALPEIMVHGLVTPTDVEKLFSIFYTKLNPQVSLLDPSLHTPATVFAACPFLFTVVCAVSSRYYKEKSHIHPTAMHFARHAAASAFIEGLKSVESCQAYILLSIYGIPAKCWEEDRNWLYAGLAIRIATDLNLFLPQPKDAANEDQERETLNKTRTWLVCHSLDHAITTQFRKPSSIKENPVVENSESWYKQSKFNGRYDIDLCAHTSLVRIVAKFREELFPGPGAAAGLNKAIDLKAVTQHHDEKLIMFSDEWKRRFSESDTGEPSYGFRSSLLPFLVNYSRLGMHLSGFQHALEKRSEADLRHFYAKCFGAATSVVETMVEALAPSGFMLYSPDSHFVSTSVASVFLLKLLRPEFSWLVEPHDKAKILNLIGRLIRTLNSPEVSIDDKHTPGLHARFLAGLLKKNHPDSGQDMLFQVPPPLSEDIAGGNLALDKEQPQPPSTQHFSGGPTQSDSMPQGWAGDVSYSSDWNQFSQIDVPYATVNPQHQLQSSDSGVDGAANSMAGLSEEDKLATLRAIGNPNWWSKMPMPGFIWTDQD